MDIRTDFSVKTEDGWNASLLESELRRNSDEVLSPGEAVTVMADRVSDTIVEDWKVTRERGRTEVELVSTGDTDAAVTEGNNVMSEVEVDLCEDADIVTADKSSDVLVEACTFIGKLEVDMLGFKSNDEAEDRASVDTGRAEADKTELVCTDSGVLVVESCVPVASIEETVIGVVSSDFDSTGLLNRGITDDDMYSSLLNEAVNNSVDETGPSVASLTAAEVVV